MLQRLFVLISALVFLSAASVFGASITVVPSGSDTFAIQGNGLERVTALDITLGYDAKVLANPGVTRGDFAAGGMLAQNLGQPGTARLAIINPQPEGISGSGTIATIRFTRKGAGSGILFLNASLIGADGKTIASTHEEPSPSADETAAVPEASADQDAAEPQGGLDGLTVGGNSTTAVAAAENAPMPGASIVVEAEESIPPVGDEKATEAAPAQAAEEQRAQTQAQAQKSSFVRKEGVADRFRLYTGPRTPEALTALFAAQGDDVRQEPSVCFADGKATLTVRVRVAPSESSPNFSLTGASLVSLKKEGEWYVVEARPERDGWDASLVLKQGEAVTEIPLTIAPPLPAAVTREALVAWLRGNPRHEGENGWVDDYIRTANYLYGSAASAKKEGSAAPR